MAISETTQVDGITITPRSPTIGALVQGADLSNDLSDEEVGLLRRALLDWKVLFFRDQDITPEQHVTFARRFGEILVHPAVSDMVDHPEVQNVTRGADSPGFENVWHSDLPYLMEPAMGTVLRMLEVPTIGGDTLFADMGAAYDGLPLRIKDRVEGRVARHELRIYQRVVPSNRKNEREVEEFFTKHPDSVEHPVIRSIQRLVARASSSATCSSRRSSGWTPMRAASCSTSSSGRPRIPSTRSGSGGLPTR